MNAEIWNHFSEGEYHSGISPTYSWSVSRINQFVHKLFTKWVLSVNWQRKRSLVALNQISPWPGWVYRSIVVPNFSYVQTKSTKVYNINALCMICMIPLKHVVRHEHKFEIKYIYVNCWKCCIVQEHREKVPMSLAIDSWNYS